MSPAINFTGGLIVGLVIGGGLVLLLLGLFAGLAHAMGAHSRQHVCSAFPVAIRVLRELRKYIPEKDWYYVDMAIGIMESNLKSASK